LIDTWRRFLAFRKAATESGSTPATTSSKRGFSQPEDTDSLRQANTLHDMTEVTPEKVKGYFESRLDFEIEKIGERLASAEGLDLETRGPNWPPSKLFEQVEMYLKGYIRAHAEVIAEDLAMGSEDTEYQEYASVLFELVSELVNQKEGKIRAALRGEITERPSRV
jgi:hypothetical protein